MELLTPDGKTKTLGVLDLQVILAQDGPDSWVAQAIEIDYAAAGTTLEDAKSRFEKGFKATIHEHMNSFGNLKNFVVSAPGDVWFDLLLKFNGAMHLYSQVEVHDFMPETIGCAEVFPFKAIDYFTVVKSQAQAS